ncbi:MAG TPA: EAL domain-containing protein [Longimicrobiaceae bacterium]|nr:EAL domain-containing protein [Longimicrobiaceae bacterium]
MATSISLPEANTARRSSDAIQIDAIARLDDFAADAALARLTRLATEVLDAPFAGLFLCQDERSVLAASAGLLDRWDSGIEDAVAQTLCRHGVSSDEPFLLYDAAAGMSTGKDSPRVTAVRACLAIPLSGSDDRNFGTLAVMDGDAREWTIGEIELLRGVAASVTTELEFRAKWHVAEKALRESEERYRTLVEDSRDAIYSTTREGNFTDFNQALPELFGYSREELLGLHAEDFYVDSADRERFRAEIERSGAVRDFEVKLRRKNGDVLDCLLTSTVRRSDDGRVLGYQGIMHDITDRKRAEEALAAAESRFRSLVEQSLVGIYIIQRGRFTYVNPRFAEIFGYVPADVTAFSSVTALVSPADRDRVVGMVEQRLVGEDDSVHYSFRGLRKGGDLVDLEVHGSRTRIDGQAAIIGTLLDVTQRVRAEEENARLAAFSRENPSPILESDGEGNLLHVNPAAQRITEEIGEIDVMALLPDNHRQLVQTCLQNGQGFRSVEVAVGEKVFSWTYHPHQASQVVHLFASDITSRRVMEEQLRYDALHDALTGLPNRMLFMERLAHSILRAKRREEYLFAVLFLDLDRFKVINDSLGHHVGDELLCTVARRLQGCLRTEDTVARFGGDEFAILLGDLSGISDATRVAERIQMELSAAVNLSGFDVFTSGSIGIALSSSAYERPEYLLRNADMAMYRAKAAGVACIEVFDRTMHAEALTRLQLETDLRRALDRGEFRVHYQPIFALADGDIVGLEALVRWEHPDRGWVAPSEFIGVAEETGIIFPLGNWVLREACLEARSWRDRLHRDDLSVTVNLSAKQFAHPDLVDQVGRVLAESGLEGSALKLEITESVIMVNSDTASELIGKLRALGVKIYLDDFGTGYSSLSSLHRLPLNALKIDTSFIGNMAEDGTSAQLVSTIISLSRSIGLEVIGEGIETQAQLNALREMGCDFGQGYLLARPTAPADLDALFATTATSKVA